MSSSSRAGRAANTGAAAEYARSLVRRCSLPEAGASIILGPDKSVADERPGCTVDSSRDREGDRECIERAASFQDPTFGTMAQSCAVASRLISMALQRLEQLHAHGHGIKVAGTARTLGRLQATARSISLLSTGAGTGELMSVCSKCPCTAVSAWRSARIAA